MRPVGVTATPPPGENIRRVATPAGEIEYQLSWKKVKRINLRVGRAGQVTVSLPLRLPAIKADEFVREKSAWLVQVREKQAARQAERTDPAGAGGGGPLPSTPQARKARAAACLPLFTRVCREWLPAFGPWRVPMPEIRVREMKSRWGSCHYKKGVIVLNSLLDDAPFACLEYVVAHELAHFVVPNHAPAFHRVMAQVMPDYLARRKQLKEYGLSAWT